MNADVSFRQSQWWVYGINAAERALLDVEPHTTGAGYPPDAPESFSVGLTTRLLRRAQDALRQLWQRLAIRREPDLLEYARSIEREMPNLATELRFIAAHRSAATD